MTRPAVPRSPDGGTSQDRIAWITGASAGIGRALALRLVREGYRVAATARRAALLEELAQESDGRIQAFAGDVTDANAIRAVVSSIESTLGPISLAVLNAGVYDPAERDRFAAAVAWRTIETNLGGTVRCLDPVLAAMLGRRRGQIVFVASLAGYGGLPGSAAYGASKAAMINLAEAIRLTHARDGIVVQVANPGFVDTAMTAPNDYAMPWMMSAEQAACRLADGIRRGRFEITFPRRLAWLVKAARLLPYAVRMPLMARVTERTRR